MIPYDKRDGKIWYNSDLVDWSDVKLHVLSHGLHYGSCVFEGERVYDGNIFKLEEHTSRFFYSAKRMGFEIPYSESDINIATKKIVSAQNVKNGYVRPVAWRGSEMMAISAQQTKIHVAIATWEWGSYFDPKLKTEGIKLNISNWRRPSPDSIPWDTKASGLYMICTLSKHEAERQGYTDSLMLDHEAIVKAYPNIVNSSDDFVNYGIDANGDKVYWEQSKVDAARVELDKLSYRNDRQVGLSTTYPSLYEQFDQLYRDINAGKFGADAKTGEWFVGITSVKTAHPKP